MPVCVCHSIQKASEINSQHLGTKCNVKINANSTAYNCRTKFTFKSAPIISFVTVITIGTARL